MLQALLQAWIRRNMKQKKSHPKKNTKQDLLEKLRLFKAEYGRLPTRGDFEDKLIEPSFMTFHRTLGNAEAMAKALDLYERGEMVFEKRELKSEVSKSKKVFQCVFCGSRTQKPFDYATCKDYIISRLIDLIKRNSENSDYTAAIFDSIAKIFGPGDETNETAERALRNEGYFEAYRKRTAGLQINQASREMEEISNMTGDHEKGFNFGDRIPKTDGYCLVNGKLVLNFWESLDPWEDAKKESTIQCEFCHKDKPPDEISLIDGLKDAPTVRGQLAKFICRDCEKKINKEQERGLKT